MMISYYYNITTTADGRFKRSLTAAIDVICLEDVVTFGVSFLVDNIIIIIITDPRGPHSKISHN